MPMLEGGTRADDLSLVRYEHKLTTKSASCRLATDVCPGCLKHSKKSTKTINSQNLHYTLIAVSQECKELAIILTCLFPHFRIEHRTPCNDCVENRVFSWQHF